MSKNRRNLRTSSIVCKIFGPKIRSCKLFDKSQLCVRSAPPSQNSMSAKKLNIPGGWNTNYRLGVISKQIQSKQQRLATETAKWAGSGCGSLLPDGFLQLPSSSSSSFHGTFQNFFLYNLASRNPILMIFTFLKMALKFIGTSSLLEECGSNISSISSIFLAFLAFFL